MTKCFSNGIINSLKEERGIKKMLFLVYNEFVGIIVVKVTRGTKEQMFDYINKIYGSRFVSIPKKFERFFARLA